MSSFKQLYLGATLLLSLTHQAACNPTEEHDLSVRFGVAQDLDARDIENIRALVERDLEIRRGGDGAGGRGGKGSSATVTDGFPGYTPGGRGGGKGRRSLEIRRGGDGAGGRGGKGSSATVTDGFPGYTPGGGGSGKGRRSRETRKGGGGSGGRGGSSGGGKGKRSLDIRRGGMLNSGIRRKFN
ncbi:unnamed protein product [Clonostachys rhizophaga]|uniref:Uncharacterized protein n=1 Tax=Clonostachys rhizophaga TaxID=160324 RepID=A0A9N9VDI7_9HYPO|nr:unnamed protein product [Clonostachys rhizophaga]